MKRQQDRETPPRSRRSRSRYSAHDDSDRERLSPDPDRRQIRGSSKLSLGSLDSSKRSLRDRELREYDVELERMQKRHYKDTRDMSDHYSVPQERNIQPEVEYRTLCVRLDLHDQIRDEDIKDKLFKEFKKFGDFNIKIVISGEFRIAYLNFRFPEDARDAKAARSGQMMLFDRLVRIDPVYGNAKNMNRGKSDYRGGGDQGGRFYDQGSPPPNQNRRGGYGTVGRTSSVNRDRQTGYGDYDRAFDNNDYDQQGQKERFPHHLDHILPEDDDKATRTLFVGNLDLNIDDVELREIFQRFGMIEDIDIKRPQKGQGNAYAFVKYYNLDMAHRAKVEMSGQYIGRFQCKIGYGKVTPTNCLWVGGLGPWVRPEKLEAEFDRFGAIHRIEWPQGKQYAYVLYDSNDAAQAACQQMRGYSLGGHGRRIRVDFSDINHVTGQMSPQRTTPEDTADYGSFRDQQGGAGRDRNYDNWHNRDYSNGNSRRGPRDNWGLKDRISDGYNRNQDSRKDFNNFDRRREFDRMSDSADRRRIQNRTSFEENQNSYTPPVQSHNNRGQYKSPPPRDRDSAGFQNQDPSPKRRRHSSPDGMQPARFQRDHASNQHERTTSPEGNGLVPNVDHVDNIPDLARNLPVVWKGSLVLKNSAFAARMHLVNGDVSIVDNLMRDPTTTEPPVLRITQRLRLDQPKLEEVGRRVHGSGNSGHSVLLAMPGSTEEDPDSNIQHRPLKNLVSYLKQKDAAGVIALPPNPAKDNKADNVGVLHAFPPCDFGQDFLSLRAPRLGKATGEDHLVIVVVRGAA